VIDRAAQRTIISLLFCAAWAAAPHAQAADTPTSVAAGLGQKALADRWSYSFLESLTSEIGPRLAGTQAEARAADWAAAKLKAAGMEVHLETFPMTAWVRGVETAEVVKPSPQRLVLTALGGSAATPPEGIEAEAVVFRTYGALLAAAPGSLTGKIAVVTEHTVRTENGEGYGAAFPIRSSGASEAARRGAIAYLHRSLGTDNHRLPHTGRLVYIDGAPRIPAAALSVPDAEQLERLAALGPVTVHIVLTPTERPNAQSVTVVGEIKGREKPNEVVLIGAHLDSWDLGTGAIDDGAGDAIVAGVGKLIADLPRHPRRTVRVVLFGAEEMDYSGAAYAKVHTAEADRIVIAGETDFGARRIYAAQFPFGAVESPFGKAVGEILPALDVILGREPAPFGGADIDGLRLAGVPVLSLSQNGMDYFDIHHSADDTFDKVDAAELAQNVAVWSAVTYLAAETDVDFRAIAKAAAH
jgi:hypothetical protein